MARSPIDIASLVWQAREVLPGLIEDSLRSNNSWQGEVELARQMLGDDPAAILESIKAAIRNGATAEALGSTIAYAAFLRMAHFHTSNEFRDWDTLHNTLTAANALHQALRRAPSPALIRGVFDIAMSIYLDRFLNMPPQRIPEPESGAIDAQPLLSELLDRIDVRQQVEEVAQIVSRYISGSGNPDALQATLGQLVLMEDSDFHAFQIVDAGFKQFQARQESESGRHVMVGLSRFLAAHSPTPRAVGQTYHIALRLHRGEETYSES